MAFIQANLGTFTLTRGPFRMPVLCFWGVLCASSHGDPQGNTLRPKNSRVDRTALNLQELDRHTSKRLSGKALPEALSGYVSHVAVALPTQNFRVDNHASSKTRRRPKNAAFAKMKVHMSSCPPNMDPTRVPLRSSRGPFQVPSLFSVQLCILMLTNPS